MRNIFFALFIITSFCNAQLQINSIHHNCDSLKAVISNLDKNQKEIKDSISYISVRAIKEAQASYDTSFNKIQSSYQIFIAIVAIIVAIAGIIVGWSGWKTKSDSEKIKKEFSEMKIEYDARLKILNDKVESEIIKSKPKPKSKSNFVESGVTK